MNEINLEELQATKIRILSEQECGCIKKYHGCILACIEEQGNTVTLTFTADRVNTENDKCDC